MNPSHILQFDKTNVVNGAYTPDASADTGFRANISSLPQNTLYLIDRAALDNADRARLLYSLQGLVNRDFGMDDNHTVLLYVMADEVDEGWLTYITAADSILYSDPATGAGLNRQMLHTWQEICQTFASVIADCGIVLWDGNVPATANLAATICGLDGYLPVLAQSPLHQQLIQHGVPVRQSLVGMFADGLPQTPIANSPVKSTGSAKNDAYLWALAQYFPRCSAQYIAYTLDGASQIKGYDAYEDHPISAGEMADMSCLSNHDYLIARRCFFFDLAVYRDEPACDDPAQLAGIAPAGLDRETMKTIFRARYDRANGEFGQIMGFPPWWQKYTEFEGRGKQDPVWIEWLFSETIGCFNLAKEADAASPASMTNGSVYYKYVPKHKKYQNNHQQETVSFDPETFYYTIYVGDFDSSAWLRQHVYRMWMKDGGDPNRNKIPLMWSFCPNLSFRVPMVFDYVYENRTDKEYFAAGDCGAGYLIPISLIKGKMLPHAQETRPQEYGDAREKWVAHNRKFYDRFDLDITGFIINSSEFFFCKELAECYNQISPVGSFTFCSQTPLGLHQGVPYVYCHGNAWAQQDPNLPVTIDPSALMYEHATVTMKGFNFGAFRSICRTPTQIYELVTNFEKYAAQKGLTVKYCDPYTYFSLLKESGQGVTL